MWQYRPTGSLGVLYCTVALFDSARDAFQQAITLDPCQTKAYMNLGQLWECHFSVHGSDEEQAVASYNARRAFWRVVKMEPEHHLAQQRLEKLGGPVEEDIAASHEEENDESLESSTKGDSESDTESLPFEDIQDENVRDHQKRLTLLLLTFLIM